jgi:hypothetical protein
MTPKERLAYDFIEDKIKEVNEKIGVVSRQMSELQKEYQKKHSEGLELNEEFKKLFDLQKKMREK